MCFVFRWVLIEIELDLCGNYDLHKHTQTFTYKNDLLNSFNHMFSGAHKLVARSAGTKM